MRRETLRAHGSSATISPYGAQVLSWVHQGAERLFLSPQAMFASGVAIRGGIPVIFPQFGERGPGPRHGFARTAAWEVVGGREGGAGIQFALRDSEATRKQWPHSFEAQLGVELGARRLSVALRVANPGTAPLSFTCALHAYLRVQDIGAAGIDGLQGVGYQDATLGGTWATQAAPRLHFRGEVDRIYRDNAGDLVLVDGPSRVTIAKSGFRDTVVWNPGDTLAARMSDLGPGGHVHFVCIEAACVHAPVELAPGDVWDGSQTLIV